MTLKDAAGSGIPGGEGGSVPVGTQVCVRTSLSAPAQGPEARTSARQSTNGTGGVEAAMVAAGVFCLSSKARWAIAEELAKLDVCGNDVERLHRWLARTEPKEGLQRRYLAGLLSNPPETVEALKTLDRHAESRRNKDRNSMGYEAGPLDGEDEDKWVCERHAQIVYCRIWGDGVTADVVAEELGKSVDDVQKLYDMGQKLYGSGT